MNQENAATEEVKEKTLKSGSGTDANKLSTAIISNYNDDPKLNLIIRSIGASALNQAVKAIIIANRFFVKKGLIILTLSYFKDLPDGTTSIEQKLKITSL